MFNKPYQERLAIWREFRNSLETIDSPVSTAIEFFEEIPLVSFQTDPYSRSTWPDPWEMINENEYCEFTKLLAVCYTLQLTERFSKNNFEIHIAMDKEKSQTYYLLFIDNTVVGYDKEPTSTKNLPNTLVSLEVYHMPKIT